MKIKNYLLILNFYVTSIAIAQGPPSGKTTICGTGTTIVDSIYTGVFTPNTGGTASGYRQYALYTPKIYTGATSVPLVINIHGLGGSDLEQEYYGDFTCIADTANFLIVLPQGTGSTPTFQNFSSDEASALIDVDFISNLIDSLKLKSKYNINLNRVYSTGMSNGGFMTDELACQLSTRIAATASVSGGIIPSHYDSCKAHNAMPYMEIHGTTDPVVSYDGARNTTGLPTPAHINTDTLIKDWVLHNDCFPGYDAPIITNVPNIDTTDGCTAIHYVFTGGTQGSSVELYKIIGGGHEWPGSQTPLFGGSGGNRCMDFSASQEIWRFFSQHTSITTGINEVIAKSNDVSVYPNPSNGTFTVKIENYQNSSIKIINMPGETIFEETILSSSTIVNMGNVPNGIYFYQIRNQTSILKSGKIIIQ